MCLYWAGWMVWQSVLISAKVASSSVGTPMEITSSVFRPPCRHIVRGVALVGCCLSLVRVANAQSTSAAKPPAIEFNRDVRPILSDQCFKCHGPGTQMRGLRLDLEDVT